MIARSSNPSVTETVRSWEDGTNRYALHLIAHAFTAFVLQKLKAGPAGGSNKTLGMSWPVRYGSLAGIVVVLLAPVAGQGQSTPEAGEIDSLIERQLEEAYALESWTENEVSETRQGPISVRQAGLDVSLKLLEPHYRPSGRFENGKPIVELAAGEGDVISIKATMIVATLPGQPVRTQVVLAPVDQTRAGWPLSRYTGGYVVAAGDPRATPTLKPAENDGQPHDDAQGVIARLWRTFESGGEIWGIQRMGEYAGAPVVLSELERLDANTLVGRIAHPYQLLSNRFKLQQGPPLLMTVEAEPVAADGVRRAIYTFDETEGRLVARLGPEIALSAAGSEAIRDDFLRRIEPWRFEGDITDYLLFGNKLIDVDTLETVSDSGIRRAAPLSTHPGRFVSVENHELTNRPFGAYSARFVQTAEPAGRLPLRPLRALAGEVWASPGLDEYLRIGEGDVWRGTIDWVSNGTTNETNLTQLGRLNDLQPLTWCGDSAYFYRLTATDKPILRIDVRNGGIEELAATRALQPKASGSPDGRFLFFSDGRTTRSAAGMSSTLSVYDCATRESFELDAMFDERVYAGEEKRPPTPRRIVPQAWVSPGVFVSPDGWFDFVNRQRVAFADLPEVVSLQARQVRSMGQVGLPGTDYRDVSIQSFESRGSGGNPQVQKRYRVHRATRRAAVLPADQLEQPRVGITWVDPQRYLYSVKRGLLDAVGTYLYNITTQTTVKISPLFHDGKVWAENDGFLSALERTWRSPNYIEGAHLVLLDKSRIVFSSTRGERSELVSVALDGRELARAPLPPGNGTLRRVHRYPDSLPRQRPQHVLQPSAFQSAAAGGVGDSTTAAGETNSEIDEVLQYCYDTDTGEQLDCECFARVFAEKRAELGPDEPRNSLYVLSGRSCPNVAKLVRDEYALCAGGSGSANTDTGGFELNAYCRCYADQYGELLSNFAGRLDARQKNQFRVRAKTHCHKSSSYN